MTGFFAHLDIPPPDTLHAISQAHALDSRRDKMDLGVGVYRNENGHSPAMAVVKRAEQILANSDGSKAYLPTRGDPSFLEAMEGLLFPYGAPDTFASIQTVGGTGGIYLALELARRANPALTVHIGQPSWPNHVGICRYLGISVHEFEHCRRGKGLPTLEAHIEHLRAAAAGDILILHGPCHNPTGRDFGHEEMIALVAQAREYGVTCLIDAAYYGLGNPLENDLQLLRNMLFAAPDTMLVMSGSKTFGLYRDRIGILFVNCSADRVEDVIAVLGNIARTTYSVPAAHGAQVIGKVLLDPAMKCAWANELDAMRERVAKLRSMIVDLADGLPVFDHVFDEKGIFSMLPLNVGQVAELARNDGIYMPSSGRINVAGLNRQTIPPFVKAVRHVCA